MTRDGLVEKNLNDQTTVRVSSRTGDLKLERKENLAEMNLCGLCTWQEMSQWQVRRSGAGIGQ